jgi:hypothetical protein
MESWNSLVEKAKADGFSVNLVSRDTPTDGYMVALVGHEEIVPVQALTVDRLVRYVKTHADALLTEQGNTYLGAWRAGDDVYLDVSERVASRAKALFLGAERGQLAVWDVVNSSEINTTPVRA